MDNATTYYQVITTKLAAARFFASMDMHSLAAAKRQEAKAIADQARAEGIDPLDGR